MCKHVSDGQAFASTSCQCASGDTGRLKYRLASGDSAWEARTNGATWAERYWSNAARASPEEGAGPGVAAAGPGAAALGAAAVVPGALRADPLLLTGDGALGVEEGPRVACRIQTA